jgi:hypothetical protein
MVRHRKIIVTVQGFRGSGFSAGAGAGLKSGQFDRKRDSKKANIECRRKEFYRYFKKNRLKGKQGMTEDKEDKTYDLEERLI